ncbi:hypothetical protein J7L65_07500 [Candidatus Bathyarchaeota archaeon]|nr:hypothetical protein [Candidatus Bathyarchaeota archaeon]
MTLRIQIDERLEREFRRLAMQRFGYGRGALSRAAEEAIMDWVSKVKGVMVSFEGDPVEAIDGLLSDIDIDAVELQHQAMKLWLTKVLGDVSR